VGFILLYSAALGAAERQSLLSVAVSVDVENIAHFETIWCSFAQFQNLEPSPN